VAHISLAIQLLLADAPGIFSPLYCYHTLTAYAVKKLIPFANNNGLILSLTAMRSLRIANEEKLGWYEFEIRV